ncbi:MAG: hypothetical protein J5850_00800, partial [Clostridia bacterium]|nr:hypothetical protein [Clostridia bacterium]
MPVEVLSGLTLSSILSVLDEKLKKVQKLFQRVEKTTEAVSGLVGLVTAGLNASTAIKNLETSRAEYVKAYSGFNSVKADFTTKLKSLINSYSDSQFETYYNMIYGNGDKTVNLSLVDDDRAFLDAFLSFADSIDTAYFFKDQNGNNLPEIVLSDEQAEWLDIMEIKNGDDAFKSEDKLVISNITERLFLKINSKTSLYKSRYNIDNPVVKWDTRSELEQTIKDLKLYPNKLETYKTVAGKFANVMNSAAMGKYETLDKKATDLEKKYSEYAKAMEALVTAADTFIKSGKELQTIENEIKTEAAEAATEEEIKETNTQGAVANAERVKYLSMTPEEKKSPAGIEQKKKAEEEAKERRAAYQKMMEQGATVNDYADIGTGILGVFVAEFSGNKLGKWKTSLSNNMLLIHEANVNKLKNGSSASAFKSVAQTYFNFDFPAVVADKVLLKSGNIGFEAFSSSQKAPEDLNEILRKTKENIENDKDEEVKSNFSSDEITKFYYDLFSEGVFNIFTPDDETNFQTAYYVSENAVSTIEFFLVAEGAVDDKTSDLWGKIAEILKLITSILPADPFLNNEIGGTDEVRDNYRIDDTPEEMTGPDATLYLDSHWVGAFCPMLQLTVFRR